MRPNPQTRPEPVARAEFSWTQIARIALGPAIVGGLVSGAMAILDQLAATRAARWTSAAIDNESTSPSGQLERDAALLGVCVDASEAEIRTAFRQRISSGSHPDHGGDEDTARALIQARDRLLAACAQRGSHE